MWGGKRWLATPLSIPMAGEPEPKRQRLVEAATFLKLKKRILKKRLCTNFQSKFMSCAKIHCRCLKFVMANAQTMQSRDSCVQREISSSITLLHTGTIKVQMRS